MTDDNGELRAMFSVAPPLPTKTTKTGATAGGKSTTTTVTTLQYDPELRSPVWHTDQAFRSPPPFASLLYCRTSPPPGSGADTAFADMTAALAALPADRQTQLAGLRAVCSYAHHNAKVGMCMPVESESTAIDTSDPT